MDDKPLEQEIVVAGVSISRDDFVDWEHEMRVSLSPVLGCIKLLLKTELTDKQAEYATIIDEHSQNLLSLLNEHTHKIIQDRIMLRG